MHLLLGLSILLQQMKFAGELENNRSTYFDPASSDGLNRFASLGVNFAIKRYNMNGDPNGIEYNEKHMAKRAN